MKRYLYMGLGWISLGLGVIGIFLPVLPTTPFLLLSAFCFQKSSERFHQWLLENKYFGQYIRDYQEQKGISMQNKILSLAFMAIGMSITGYKVGNLYMNLSFVVIFAGVAWHICSMKTIKK